MDVGACDVLLSTTRSVRYRLDLSRPVDRSVITECLRVAIQAPTGGNTQGWRWLAIDDPERKAEIAAWYRAGTDVLEASAAYAKDEQSARVYKAAEYLASVLEHVPVLIIPCVQGRLEGATTLRAASIFGSILPAVWSFMLALRSRGLSSAWTTLHLQKEREVADYLGIPAGFTQVALIPVAHTVGDKPFRPAQRRPVEEVTFWNRWDVTS
jgi:nitroreductase